jgi:hypothetical protein
MNVNVTLRNVWFAGFYEGEGWVSNDKSNNNRIHIGIAQNDPVPLEIGKQYWGGSVRKRVRKSPASDKICTGYEWKLNHNDALKFIEDIQQYMLIPYKINQLEKTLKVFNTVVLEYNYKCNFCDSLFKCCSNRRRHELTQHINKNTLFHCDIEGCDKTYKTRATLSRHKKLNHL